jgi:uncharacterized membrane protein
VGAVEHIEPMEPAEGNRILEELLHPDQFVDRIQDTVERRVIPAWKRATEGEHRTVVTFAILVAIGLIVALPPRVANRPRLLLPTLALTLLIALVIASPSRVEKESKSLRALSLTLIAVMSIANAVSGGRLVVDLARAQGIRNPASLLETGAEIWLTNIIVFALWYWESDRGGPVQRAMGTHDHPDFFFPQMDHPEMVDDNWEPYFVDYLYLSFTNATAFSPTDVVPMSRWAKMVMMVQSMTSIVTVGLVIARAVNVLK